MRDVKFMGQFDPYFFNVNTAVFFTGHLDGIGTIARLAALWALRRLPMHCSLLFGYCSLVGHIR